jgi:hypothetical protein
MFPSLNHESRPHIVSLVKAYLRRHGLQIREDENPEMALMEACGCVTAEKARGRFHHAGYIWNDI